MLKKCPNCNAELKEEARFCPQCGANLIDLKNKEETMSAENKNVDEIKDDSTLDSTKTIEEKDSSINQMDKSNNNFLKKTKNQKIIPVLSGIVAIAIIIIIFVLNATPTIDLNKYAIVSFEGYDGYGQANVMIDWDKIKEDYKGKIKYSKKINDQYNELFGNTEINLNDVYGPENVMQTFVYCELDTEGKNGYLSNGDTIKLKWTIDEKYTEAFKVKFKTREDSYTVSELKEVEKKDFFKNLDVSFSGYEPQGKVELSYNGDELDVSDFSVDKSENLSNGDKIKIDINILDISYFVQKYGTIPEKSEKEYTVKGLPAYITKTTGGSGLTEIAKTNIKLAADDVITAWVAESKKHYAKYSATGTEYIGNFVLSKKDMTSDFSYYNPSNIYYVIYKITYELNADYDGFWEGEIENTGDYYVAIGYVNITTDDDCYVLYDPYTKGSSLNSGNVKKDNLGFRSLEKLKNDVIDIEAVEYDCDGWNY